MNKRPFLPILCFLLLVSLLAVPVFAATVTCPSDCSCLLPAEAKKLGSPGYCSGKQAVCGYDTQKNEKYCYTKASSPTTIVPQLVVTGVKPVVTTTATTKPVIAPVTTTLPVVGGSTRVTPSACPDTCACMPDEKAQLAAVPLSLCGGTKTWCGDTAAGVHEYCYIVPETATTTVPGLRTRTEPCGSGCTCLATDKADAIGLKQCLGMSTLPCGYDPVDRPMRCYVLTTTETTKATATTTTTGTILVPIRLDITPGPTTAAPAPNVFSSFSTFVATLFGGGDAVSAGGGSSTILACPFGLTACDGACVDLRSDRKNCGRCRNICPNEGAICCDGVCSNERSVDNCGGCGNACSIDEPCFHLSGGDWFCSPAGCGNNNRSMDCGTGYCIYLNEDRQHCGGCGNVCPAGSVCENGECTSCPAGEVQCGMADVCQDTLTSPYSCGGCGIVCDPDKVCVDGRCTACPPGLNRCGDGCRDLQTAFYNCGACDNACVTGETSCCSGHCVPLLTNMTNCGSCGNACGESQRCIGGTCALMPTGSVEVTCRLGQTACSGTCTDLETDEFNCGTCGRACMSGRVCIEGECLQSGGEDGCGFGQIRCSGRCVNPDTNIRNCGACGNVCPDRYYCRDSTCTPYAGGGSTTTCETPGLTYCDGDCADLATSTQHCGRCGRSCSGGTCSDGECYYTDSDRANCGSVGHRCATGEICCSGTCRAENTGDPERCACTSAPCRAADGLGCCNGYCWALGSDTHNCGACGHVCDEGDRCCGGRCTDIWWDERNCGRCGHSCPWNKECQNGHCCLWGTTWGCE